MRGFGRRPLLLAALGAACAACGRAQPALAPQATVFGVWARARASATPPPSGLTAVEQWSQAFAAGEAWWRPVLQAFNDSHPRLRAIFAALGLDPQPMADGGWSMTRNPGLSCVAGLPLGFDGGTVDLAPTMRDANLDVTALLPGLIEAASDRDGSVRGMPMDFELLAMEYDAKALAKVGIAVPPVAGWTADQFVAVVEALGATGSPAALFGDGLATQFPSGTATAWFGYAEGFGGQVFGERVVLASGPAYEGLRAYADILQTTWAGALETLAPDFALGFQDVGLTTGSTPWPARQLTRFPRLPSPVAPADVLVAAVPVEAPEPAAGATFAVWLASIEGQRALTALGYPSIRLDGDALAPFQRAQTGVVPADLRFRPGGIFGVVYGGNSTGHLFNFDFRLVTALVQPEAERIRRLQAFEQALTGVVNGSLSLPQANQVLVKAGV